MRYGIIYLKEDKNSVDNEILRLFKQLERIEFSSENLIKDTDSITCLILFLPDEEVKKVLSQFIGSEKTLAFLPHPSGESTRNYFGLSKSIKEEVEQLLNTTETDHIDILTCNSDIVLKHVVIGRSFLPKQYTGNKFWNIKQRIKRFYFRFLNLKPFSLSIKQNEDNTIKTAVSGVTIIPHKTRSLFAQFVPGSSAYNDGLLHALIVSPRSVLQLIKNAFSTFFRTVNFPEYGAQVKVQSLHISSEELLEFSLDTKKLKAKELAFEIHKKSIQFIPGSEFEKTTEEPSSAEAFKVQHLPKGEAAKELTMRTLPFIRRASTEDFKELFQLLRSNAQTKSSYLVLMVLSTVLAIFGLFANSSPVVIGAMILAPLMSPIISLSMGALRQDNKLVLDSSKTILSGLGIAFAAAVLITFITPIKNPNSEILLRTSPTLLDLGIAVISGVAGAYAHAREEVAKTLAGVAIAVALVPPLAVAAIGFGWLDWPIFFGATLLLFTNLAGMTLAAALTFMLLGFSPFRLATKAVLISSLVVLIFSVPLFISFRQMVDEHKIVQLLDGKEVNTIQVKDVKITRSEPLTLAIKVVAKESLTDLEIEDLKSAIERRIGRPIQLELTIALKR